VVNLSFESSKVIGITIPAIYDFSWLIMLQTMSGVMFWKLSVRLKIFVFLILIFEPAKL